MIPFFCREAAPQGAKNNQPCCLGTLPPPHFIPESYVHTDCSRKKTLKPKHHDDSRECVLNCVPQTSNPSCIGAARHMGKHSRAVTGRRPAAKNTKFTVRVLLSVKEEKHWACKPTSPPCCLFHFSQLNFKGDEKKRLYSLIKDRICNERWGKDG